jgi:hypothetical protein
MRLFAGDMISDEEILASLQQLRIDIAAMSAAVETNIARAPSLPHRARYLLLLQDLGRRLLQAHTDWLDEVERKLSRERVEPTRHVRVNPSEGGGDRTEASGRAS